MLVQHVAAASCLRADVRANDGDQSAATVHEPHAAHHTPGTLPNSAADPVLF